MKLNFDFTKFKIIIFAAMLVTGSSILTPAAAQQLHIVNTNQEYQQSLKRDSSFEMVELKSVIPTLVYDLRYATTNNFTGKQLYKRGKETYMRAPAAAALQRVQAMLAQQGLGLKIWDAYRPYAVTETMWNMIKDERYVANPAKGSGHNRGLAVDVTIINLATGKELNMGTGYDNFTDTAHHTFTQLPPDVQQNRTLLKNTMERAGFTALQTEWWHYYWPNNKNYDVLNLSFQQLAKTSKGK